MARKGRHDFDVLTEAQLLAGLTSVRRVCVETLTRIPAGEPMRASLAELLDAIDHIAEAATGDRSFLHLKPRRTRAGKAVPPSAE